MRGAKSTEQSNMMRTLVEEDRHDHIFLFGHDDYYKYLMWMKFESNNEEFNVYDSVLSATKWLMDILSQVINFCTFRQ